MTENENNLPIEKSIREMEIDELLTKKKSIEELIKKKNFEISSEKNKIENLKNDIINSPEFRDKKLKDEDAKFKEKIKNLLNENLNNTQNQLVKKKEDALIAYKNFKNWFLLFCLTSILLIVLFVWAIDFENVIFLKDIIKYIGPDLSIALSLIILIIYFGVWWLFTLMPLYLNMKKIISEINKIVDEKISLLKEIINVYNEISNLHIDFRIHFNCLRTINEFRGYLKNTINPKLLDLILKMREKNSELIKNYSLKLKEILPSSNTIYSLFKLNDLEKIDLQDYDQVLKKAKEDLIKSFWKEKDLIDKFILNIEDTISVKYTQSFKNDSLSEIILNPNLLFDKFNIKNDYTTEEYSNFLKQNSVPATLPLSLSFGGGFKQNIIITDKIDFQDSINESFSLDKGSNFVNSESKNSFIFFNTFSIDAESISNIKSIDNNK